MLTKRNIIKIDEQKCNGCGLCVTACAEGAIQIINGKAKLISDSYCDGLGACLGHCPQDAITIEQRTAEEFDEQAVHQHLQQKKENSPPAFQCPGSLAKKLETKSINSEESQKQTESQLANWPVQLKLVSPSAPYFQNADLLLVADCVPFALPDFHSKILLGNPVIVGCPKLDNIELYEQKLFEILKANNINSLTVVHMEVPCCSGLIVITKSTLDKITKNIPVKDITISINGAIISEKDMI